MDHHEVSKAGIDIYQGDRPACLIQRALNHAEAIEDTLRAELNPFRLEPGVIQRLQASIGDTSMGGDEQDIRIALLAAPDDLKIGNDLVRRIGGLLGCLQIDHLFELVKIGGGELEVANGYQITRNREEDVGIRGNDPLFDEIKEYL